MSGGKKSKKGIQGSSLPVDGSRLSAYPVGSCVLIEIGGSAAWHLITNRIGGIGNPHVRRLVNPPTSSDWNAGPSQTKEISDGLVVQRSAWPRRVTDERSLDANSDPDPILGNFRSVDGDGDGDGADGYGYGGDGGSSHGDGRYGARSDARAGSAP